MPTLTVQPTSKDTFLSEGLPSSNYGGSTFIQVRNWNEDIRRIILEFDISSLPSGATINSATLSLNYYAYDVTDPNGYTIWAYKLSRTDWVESEATWQRYKSGSNWTSGGGDYVTSSPAGGSTTFPSSYGWMSWNVLAIVQDAYNASRAAEILLKFSSETAEGASSSLASFRSKEYATSADRPKLVIDYTEVAAPTVSTSAATGIQTAQFTGNGNIIATGGANATRRGFCYLQGTSGTPTTANSVAYDDGSYGTGTYSKAITGLSHGTSYRVRAYAVNSAGTGYGDTITVKTSVAASLSGAITPAGSAQIKSIRGLSGALTPSGVVASRKGIFVSLSGTLTSSGTVGKKIMLALSGSLTPTGIVTSIKTVFKSLSGVLSPTGILTSIKTVFVTLTGQVTSSGALAVKIFVALSGAITPTGTIGRKILIALSGALAPTGTINKGIKLALSGVVSSAGELYRKIKLALSGAITSAGQLWARKPPVIEVSLSMYPRSLTLETYSRSETLYIKGTH